MSEDSVNGDAFEASVKAMLERRSADIGNGSTAFMVDPVTAPTDELSPRRRFAPVLAAAALVALIVGLVVWVARGDDQAVRVADRPEAADPELSKVDATAPAPSVVFDADGNVLFEFGPDTEIATTTIEGVSVRTVVAGTDDYRVEMVRDALSGLGDGASAVSSQLVLRTNPATGAPFFTRGGRLAGVGDDPSFGDGLQIYTTFDQRAQDMALAAVDETLPEDERGFTMAAVAIDPASGGLQAVVGGPGLSEFGFNLATASTGRQPGSAFWTVVAAAALDIGYLPTDVFDGRGPCRFPAPFEGAGYYNVENFGGSLGGVLSMSRLLTNSSNCGAVELGQHVGIPRIIDMANRLGIGRDERAVPLVDVMSLPLGTSEVSVLDMATMQATLANDGVHNDPYFIDRIESADGQVLYQHATTPVRALRTQAACRTMEMLAANVQGGTGTRTILTDQPAAGKTGTTEGGGDAWFVGSTPYLATAIWMGHPEGNMSAMTDVGGLGFVTGGSFPAQAWGDFNRRYHDSLPRQDLKVCEPDSREGRAATPIGEFGLGADGEPQELDETTVGPDVSTGPLGEPQGSQVLDSGRLLDCPVSHPYGYDTDDDGVIDICYSVEQ